MATKLPNPATTTELYLAAILEELRRVRELLTPPQPLQGDRIELVEKKPRRT